MQTGPKRQNVAVRLTDEELATVRAFSESSGRSISYVLRELMALPPSAKDLALRPTEVLQHERELRIQAYRAAPATGEPISAKLIDALWINAIETTLERRYPASVDEFLTTYAVRLHRNPLWIQDGAARTVRWSADVVLDVRYGSNIDSHNPHPGVSVGARHVPSGTALHSSRVAGSTLPSVRKMGELLHSVGDYATRQAAQMTLH